VVAEYRYDGLSRRIRKLLGTDPEDQRAAEPLRKAAEEDEDVRVRTEARHALAQLK